MAVAHQGTQTGSISTSSSTVTVASNAAGTDSLYLCAINCYGTNSSTPTDVSTVSGGSGLSWAKLNAGCSGRIQNPHTEIWWAYGSPGTAFTVTVTMAANCDAITASVSRYTGTSASAPVGTAYENTNGLNGTCGGGTDNSTPNLELTSANDNSVLFVVTHTRQIDLATADVTYTERASVVNDAGGGSGASLHVHEKLLATAGTDNCDHTTSSDRPWICTGCVIEESGGGGGGGGGPIVYVRTAGALGANFSMDIGTAGTDRLVTIHIGDERATLIGVTAVTVDGKSCTKLHDIVNTIGAGNAQQFWYITESTLGSSNGSVTIAFTGTWDTGHRAQAMLHTGVQDGAPYDSGYDNTSGAVGTVTVTGIDCPADGVVVAGWGQGQIVNDTITSIMSPHIERYNETPGSATLAGSSGIETAQQTNKTYVLDWNATDGYRHTGIVASWAEASASAPSQTHQMML